MEKKLRLNLTDEQKGEILGKEGKEFVGPRFSNTVVDSVVPKSAADVAGLKKGDKIKALNGKRQFTYYDEFKEEFLNIKKKTAFHYQF
jgi:regulator of sigma E protease